MDASTLFCVVCLALILYTMRSSEKGCLAHSMHAKSALLISATVTTTMNEQHCTMHRMKDTFDNESYIVSATVSSSRVLFMLDTAYAGAPVLSGHYLALMKRGHASTGTVQEQWTKLRQYMSSQKRNSISDAEIQKVIREFVQNSSCRSFTSGCTMRLMGIGSTSEAQSDMFLCPSLDIADVNDRHQGDVLVTNPLRGSVHILTSDYCLHRQPVVIEADPSDSSKLLLILHADKSRRGKFVSTGKVYPVKLVGGAFLVPMTVGGATLQVVVDTGAAACLSISKSALHKMKTCALPKAAKRARQAGVNGEKICSDIVLCDIGLGGSVLNNVNVFVNSMDVQGADGYAGVGLLRAFDIWFTSHEIGFVRNQMPLLPTNDRLLSPGYCTNSTVQSKCTRI